MLGLLKDFGAGLAFLALVIPAAIALVWLGSAAVFTSIYLLKEHTVPTLAVLVPCLAVLIGKFLRW